MRKKKKNIYIYIYINNSNKNKVMLSLIRLLYVMSSIDWLIFFHSQSCALQNFVNGLNLFYFIAVFAKCLLLELAIASFVYVLFNDAVGSSYYIASGIVTISE
jgi:hypothetical protein